MTPGAVAVGLCLLLGRSAGASRSGAATHAPKARSAAPAADLPMLPSVSRVRVETLRDRVLLLQDVDLPRGHYKSGSLDLYAAFGAPGPPLAVDAHLIGPSRDNGGPAGGEHVALRVAFRRHPGTLLLLGQPQMAGIALHLGADQLRRAYSAGDHAVLRIRSLLPAPATDSTGARSVVVRLGIAGGLPLTVDRIQVASRDPAVHLTGAEATLCGPEADPSPLAVGWLRPSAPGSKEPPRAPALAPSAAVRHATDDLCIRWWTAPSPARTTADPAELGDGRKPRDLAAPRTSAAPGRAPTAS